MLREDRASARDERGVVTVLFALLLGLILMFGSLVISVGSWYTHARQLQTKVDAGALAGGGAWSFPCAPEADTRIRDTARIFVGEHTAAGNVAIPGLYNQQVGGVEGDQIYVTLNQSAWWNNGFPGMDFTSPAGSVCESLTLDVKATENDSPLLWGWIPFLPDIKRKARVEIEEPNGLNEDVLPIAVRVPKPESSAAVFFDETDGDILGVRHFEEKSDLVNFPPGLEGFSTRLVGDELMIPSLSHRTGVAIALSFRPACGTADAEPPCFEDEGHLKVNDLCNQGGSGGAIVKCYHGTGSGTSQSITTGLHFLRGYQTGEVGNGPPQLRGAFLESTACESNGYFNSIFVGGCAAKLTVNVDIGSVVENVGGGGGDDDDDDDDDDGKGKGGGSGGGGGGGCVKGTGQQQTRIACNVEVRYKLVRADGTTFCDYGTSCELHPADPTEAGTDVTYSTQGNGDAPHVPLAAAAGAHAIAIQVRVGGSSVSPSPGNCGINASFNDNCRWFHLGGPGTGIFGTSVPPTDPQILASPVQRAFMGDLEKSGPVKFLRIGKDLNCNRTIDSNPPEALDGHAGTHFALAGSCWYVDMGLKGGMAKDQDEPPFVFDEGSGSSQMGFLDCDPQFGQGEQLTEAILHGCDPLYRGNRFDTDPLCPDANHFFDFPKPPPFDDWEPIDCVKTRPTGGGNQLIDGLNLRIFGVLNNPKCPPDNAGKYVRGRNYWHRENNKFDLLNFAWDRDTFGKSDDLTNRILPDDPRLVTLFLTPYETFSSSGQETFPVVALGRFYVTGWGRLNGDGSFQGGGPVDPCSDGADSPVYPYTANEPPPDLNAGGSAAGGAVVWGHFIKGVVQSASTGGGTGKPCDPKAFTPCVPVLVE
jgi:hypothetical protein